MDKDLRALADRGLVGLGEAGALIHPLLAEVARLQDAAAEGSALPGPADALGEMADGANESGLPEKFKPLRAHVEAAGGWAEQGGLEQAAGLWNRLGWHLDDVAEYAGAKTAYLRALAILEKKHGADHPDMATIINNLGLALRAQGDHTGARAAFERALLILRKFLPADHPNIRIVEGNLEQVKAAMGEKDEGNPR